jgi:glycosyltransferase involved in cell wall biosynthesis
MKPSVQTPHFVFMRLMPPVIVWGGLEKLMLEWFERIDYGRCRATLVVSTGGKKIFDEHLAQKDLPVHVVEFPFRVDFKYTDGFFKRLTKTRDLLKVLKPSEVIFFQGSFTCFDLSHVLAANLSTGGEVYMHENLGPPAPSPKTSKKYFGFLPGLGLWWYAERFLTPLRARFSKKVFAVSREIKDQAVGVWHYPQHKVDVLYHGVDLKRFFPSEDNKERLRRQWGVATDETVIVAASRLSQEKCVERTLEAFDALSREYPQARLLIAGTGPQEAALQEHSAKLACRDRIKFLGRIDNVDELYQLSDIYVLSSDNEGLSLAFLEALASGLVCVTTDCPGTSEVIENEKNGFLVEKSTQGVLNGLRLALDLSGEERNAMVRSAVSLIKERFEIGRNVQKAFELLGIPYKFPKNADPKSA